MILLDLAKADHSHATIGGTRDREMADPACSVSVALEPNAFHPRRSGRHGGSTTMALRGQMMSHPSDGAGERHVGDALLVLPPRRR
jgi:hypothetical protein